MMTISTKINKVRDALLTVSKNVGHYEAFKKDDAYIVWAEDMEGGRVSGDNRKIEQSIQGTVDYFTKTESDTTVDAIQKALNDARIAFYLGSIQYEDETGYIHYEWVWEV